MYGLTLRVKDLGLAAALVSCGFELQDVKRDENHRMYFIFTQKYDLDRAVSNYRADTLNVKARRYFDNIKMLKNMIYTEE